MDGDGFRATIIQFPGVRIDRPMPSIEAVLAIAPTRSLIEALIDEVGLDRRDMARGFGRQFAYLARAIEVGGGPDDATFRLRHLVDVQVLHAMELCEAFRASADLLMELEIATARSERISGKAQRTFWPEATTWLATRSAAGADSRQAIEPLFV